MRALLILIFANAALVAAPGIRLEGFESPFPERIFRFQSQQQELEMVYMDVAPAGEARGVVLLLHGKNFSGTYFGETAAALRDAGYRVVVPDQVGFGKSSKPAHYQFSFQQLARNTHALLHSLGIEQVHVLGHSMGGMLATRFALMYPHVATSLVLLNPIGLEDWKSLGVPYTSIDDLYKQELASTPEKIRAYQLDFYYDGKWRPAYDPWLEQLASFTRSPDYPRMAWNQALTSDMVMTQPVLHEFTELRLPVLLIIGQRDRTAPGKASAPPLVQEKLGNYPALGREANAAIARSQIVELDGLGHLPHIEDFPRFFAPYREFLDQETARQLANAK